MLKRLVENEFKEDYDVTVGVEFGSFLVKVEDKIMKLQIWDTAGQESFRSITKIFYRGAHAAILGYSIAHKSTFDNLVEWLNEARASCAPDVQLFLVGNKSDLESHREVYPEQAMQFQRENDLLYFQETSAKSGENIDVLFTDVAKFIYKKYRDSMHKVMDDETSSQNSNSGTTTPGIYTGGTGVKPQHLKNKLRESQQRNMRSQSKC